MDKEETPKAKITGGAGVMRQNLCDFWAKNQFFFLLSMIFSNYSINDVKYQETLNYDDAIMLFCVQFPKF